MTLARGEKEGGRGGSDTSRDKAISNGPNARPRDETIGQTGPGIPYDSSKPIEIDREEEKRLAKEIRNF